MELITRMYVIRLFAIIILIMLATFCAAILIDSIDKRMSSPSEILESDLILETKSIKKPPPLENSFQEDLFNECISHIKKYEALGETRYFDNDGSTTIGYGHHIVKNEHFPDTITEDAADKVLRNDFTNYVGYAEKYVDDYNKQLAIGMLIYNIGETKFKKSRLRKLVEGGLPIDREIVKWKHFRHNGVKIVSEGLRERREFELYIYNLNS